MTYVLSSQRGALFWSQRVEDILGYSSQTLLESPFIWHDSIHPDDVAYVDAAIEECGDSKIFDLEYRVRDVHGQWHWLHDRLIDAYRAGDEIIIEGLATDITERKQVEEERQQLEAQHRQARRLEALGTLSGGIAHDFNNLLGTILGYTELLLQKIPDSDAMHAYLTSVHQAGERAADGRTTERGIAPDTTCSADYSDDGL